MTIALCNPARAARSLRFPVQYGIVDTIVVQPHDDAVSLWVPVISETPYQRVIDFAIEGAVSSQLLRDTVFGNSMLFCLLDLASGSAETVTLSYTVERLPVTIMLDPDCARPLSNAMTFARHLAGEKHVDVNDKTRALARRVIGKETNPLAQARLLYDHVTGAMSYDAAQQSWQGSTEHALACSVGNCNDIHALFISLSRSAGIPARLILGQALEAPKPGEEACELCGYHCCAEFFCAGIGWVPVDASCACKYGKHALFGDLEMNHIAWSVGRDIELAPPQQGEPILFFAGPYAEAGREPYRGFRRYITFEQLT
jgi:transglutaminase-like putative cysteine protease